MLECLGEENKEQMCMQIIPMDLNESDSSSVSVSTELESL